MLSSSHGCGVMLSDATVNVNPAWGITWSYNQYGVAYCFYLGRGVKLLVLRSSSGFTTVMEVVKGLVVMATITRTGQTELPA